MNKIYLYNGDFDNLISLILSLFRLNITPSSIKNENNFNIGLFDEATYLNIKDYSINTFLKNKISPNIYKTIYYIFLSEEDEKELIIYYFLKNAMKYKNEVYKHLNLRCVLKAKEIEKSVRREVHKFKGFLRFKEINSNLLYAKVAPSSDIIILLAEHFKSRLKNECFLIKDEKRGKYAFYDKSNLYILLEEDIINLDLKIDENEEAIEKLWKTFFKAVAIKERTNLRAQKNFMPKKYWKNILEMGDTYENSNK